MKIYEAGTMTRRIRAKAIRKVNRREGRYLLRTNLSGEPSESLWKL